MTRFLPTLAAVGLVCAGSFACQTAKKDSVQKVEERLPSPRAARPVDADQALAGAEEDLLSEAIARARSLDGAPAQPAPSAGKLTEVEEHLARLLLAGPRVRSWAAFGLGLRCDSAPQLVEPLLAASAGIWLSAATKGPDDELVVLARALGFCQTTSAEATLSGWLAPSPAADADVLIRSAAAGLGSLADLTGALSERSQAALLDAALARKDPFLLYPLSRLRNLPGAVGERLLEVAGSLLMDASLDSRLFAILALGSVADGVSTSALTQVLLKTSFSAAERSTAAHALARLGEPGQVALDEASASLLARGLPTEGKSALWAPLRATLEALDLPQRSTAELRKLAALAIPERTDGPAGATRRRLIWLRCRAADLLARDRTSSVTLTKCDPDAGLAFELAQIHVLARSRIELGRRQALEERLASKHPAVVEAALRLVAGHAELGDVRGMLQRALTAQAPGTRAVAAKILAAYPSRAHDPKRPESGPDPGIVQALRDILSQTGPDLPEETVASAMGAAAALSTLALKPLIEAHCKGPRPALRDSAERALAMLGGPGQRCPGPTTQERAEGAPPPPQPPLTLEFQSDFGPLRLVLDQPATSHARAWIRRRLESGELTRGPVHAMSPGLTVQFGDADGDGFESDLPVLDVPLEVSPAEFGRGSVGLSSFAAGALGSQLLVTLEPMPSLWGRRVLLGHAEGPWDLLWPGDPISDGRAAER